MTDAKPPVTGRAKLIGIAAVVGALIGIGAVYVTRSGDGNGTADAACAGAPALAAKLDPLATGEVAAFRPVERGVSLSELAFAGPDGEALTVASFSGQTVLLNLWATWCAPCRREMPALDRLEAAMGGDKFKVVAVNVDTGNRERAERFLDEIGVAKLAFYGDPSLAVFNEMKRRGLALGLPTTVLIDANGCQLGVLAGPAEWNSEDARRLVSAAIEGT
jgi:thiol-disulfide isomerase/thioredoxin